MDTVGRAAGSYAEQEGVETADSKAELVIESSESQTSSSTLGVSNAGATEKEMLRQPSAALTLLLCLLSAVEGADLQLLPCAFDAMRRDLHLTLENLATIGTVQAFCSIIAGPIWAFVADQRILSRRTILIFGSIGQGAITMLLAGITSWVPMLVLRALNGVMLASLRPVCMGIVADMTSEQCRGKVFGRIQLTSQLGMLVSTMSATPLSKAMILGHQGWRIVFVAVGILGVLIGTAGVLALRIPEMRPPVAEQKRQFKLVTEAKHLLSCFRSPTFNVLILQGLFGCMAISAGTFSTMYFQMIGISDFQAGLITSFGQLACALGILVGGHVGDAAAKVWRRHGRVLVAEVSLSVGIPLTFVRFWGIPGIEGSFLWYCVLVILHGLFAVWVTAGAKLPLLSEIVPLDRISAVMAWDSTIEGSLSALLGAPTVALLAKTMFGFTPDDLTSGRHSANAQALGRSSALMSCVPALLSLLCWPLMHLTYPRDLQRKADEEAKEMMSKDSQNPIEADTV